MCARKGWDDDRELRARRTRKIDKQKRKAREESKKKEKKKPDYLSFVLTLPEINYHCFLNVINENERSGVNRRSSSHKRARNPTLLANSCAIHNTRCKNNIVFVVINAILTQMRAVRTIWDFGAVYKKRKKSITIIFKPTVPRSRGRPAHETGTCSRGKSQKNK